MRQLHALAALCALGLPCGAAIAQGAAPADLIVTNARIYTVDDTRPMADAMAIRGGRVQFVGSARGALATRGLALALVSNIMRTPGDVLGTILDRSGLRAPFKVLTFSDECGIRKPAPEIFHLTLRQLGVAPEEAVHVGDDPVLDVEGARDAGMRVVQVSPDGRATAPVKPDAVIRSLAELPGELESLGL